MLLASDDEMPATVSFYWARVAPRQRLEPILTPTVIGAAVG